MPENEPINEHEDRDRLKPDQGEAEAQHQSAELQRAQAQRQDEIGSKALSDALKVSFAFLKIAMIVLVVIYLGSGFFYVKPGEAKVKVRFGKPVKVAGSYVMRPGSGWHLRWPWEDMAVVPTTEQTIELDKEFWYRALPEGQTLPPRRLDVRWDGYLITGDVNIVHLQLKARCRTRSDDEGVMDYVFAVQEPAEVLKRYIIEAVIQTVGRTGVMDVFTEKKALIREDIERTVRDKLTQFEQDNGFSVGMELTSIEFATDPTMALTVKDAFDAAMQAQSEMNQLVREAEKGSRSIAEEAKGTQAQIVAKAMAYKRRLETVAKADADTLMKLRQPYEQSDDIRMILRDRFYYRIVEELLGQGEESFILHASPEGTAHELRILIAPPPRGAEERAAAKE